MAILLKGRLLLCTSKKPVSKSLEQQNACEVHKQKGKKGNFPSFLLSICLLLFVLPSNSHLQIVLQSNLKQQEILAVTLTWQAYRWSVQAKHWIVKIPYYSQCSFIPFTPSYCSILLVTLFLKKIISSSSLSKCIFQEQRNLETNPQHYPKYNPFQKCFQSLLKMKEGCLKKKNNPRLSMG